MPRGVSKGNQTTRRCSPEEKAAAVGMVGVLRAGTTAWIWAVYWSRSTRETSAPMSVVIGDEPSL